MTHFSLFNSPFLLGFDQFERTLDRVTKTGHEGYPPYNIVQLEDGALRITLAVAGFDTNSLNAAIEGNELVIEGAQKEEDENHVFHHRGIANRKFQRRFVLADGIEVTDASYDNGLLHIDLVQPSVENQTRKITIRADRAAPEQTRSLQAENVEA